VDAGRCSQGCARKRSVLKAMANYKAFQACSAGKRKWQCWE